MICVEGTAALAKKLEGNVTLQELDLSRFGGVLNAICYMCIRAVADRAHHRSGKEINDKDVVALAPALEKNKKLDTLNLS